MDLLITPYKADCRGWRYHLELDQKTGFWTAKEGQEAQVAYLQGLSQPVLLREVLRVIFPMTQWWARQEIQGDLRL